MPELSGYDGDATDVPPNPDVPAETSDFPQFGSPDLADMPGADGGEELPPWALPGVEDGAPEMDLPEDTRSSAEKKAGSFMTNIEGPVTRQQAIEFINLLRWAKEGCSTFIFVSLLWLSFLLLVDIHAHIGVSYEVYRKVTTEVNGLVAQASRGIAPKAIFSAAGESMCSCTCPALCGQRPLAGGEVLPGVPQGAPLFNGTVLPEQLQTMRAKSFHLRNLGQAEKMITLREVNDIPNVWFWLQHGMVPTVWHEEDRGLPVDTRMLFSNVAALQAVKDAMDATEKPGHIMRWNKVIGGIRLRQRRLTRAGCRANDAISANFNQSANEPIKCHKDKESVIPFGPGLFSYAEGFVPNEKERGAFDIFLDTERPIHIALETIQYMLQAHHWLDSSTKSLQVQAPLVNLEASPALLGLLEIRFEFTRNGDMTKKVDVWTAAASPYPAGFSLVMIPDFVWTVLLIYLVVKKIVQIIKHRRAVRRHLEEHDVLCNFWFMFDWATELFGCCIVASWVYIVLETGSIGTAITEMPAAPPFDAREMLIKNYHAAWGDILDRLEYLTVLRERLRLAQFGYSMILIFQFMKAFRGQPKLAQLTRTLINAFEDLIHFVACFVVLFLTFAFSAHLVYGARLEDWSTSTKCVNAAFRALRGDIALPDMYEIAPITTIVWFWCFLVVNIFVMMNLLLATVYDHYQLVKNKANAFTGVLLQAKDFVKDLWHREGIGMLCCRCCCRCRRRDDYPPYEDMLEDLMHKAGYTAKERHHVFRTVLGPKWMRKKTEKHVFAGEVHAEHIKEDEQVPAREDLQAAGACPDYCESLLADADNYREREFDPEEIHVNQMRELVTLAEIEMAMMRKRLDECQGHTRLTMHDLARRLEALEHCVHKSLSDLVYLAGAAGVPHKSHHDPTKPASKAQLALADTYKRVMEHLGQGMIGNLKKERQGHQDLMARGHNTRRQNDTYARLHTNARLAHAFGEEERKRLARDYAMHVRRDF